MSKISNRPIRKIDAGRKSAAPATRGQILALLKREGEQPAAQLARSLSLTTMAARLQLYELETEGLVASRSEARGRGRPTKLWILTDAAARVFPDAHQGLAVHMIKSIEELFGAEGLAQLIRKHGDTQRRAYGDKLQSAKTPGDRVKRLAKLRNEEGYMAEAQKDGRDWLLIENNCPICSAAKACTGLCAGELKVFQDVLGKDVTVKREEHILAGARRCAYRVRAA